LPYFYTAIVRQPTISALNQASPERRFALRIQISFIKVLKVIDLSEFLMTQHLSLFCLINTRTIKASAFLENCRKKR